MVNRSLSWSAALADLRTDRVHLAPGVLSAQSLVTAYARLRGVRLVVAGRVDRTALMRLAIEAAHAHRARTRDTWAASLSIALRGAWAAARLARPVTKLAPVAQPKAIAPVLFRPAAGRIPVTIVPPAPFLPVYVPTPGPWAPAPA